ncbi:hypothetical protein E1091_02960 [Micromonospora fluostatini]|uniref:Uncharacterized protein n=1 Tax=Micromonospora fluostatini TaxID=1629071 RepID=A0ABY2DQP4_9ACTN|nr:hypothetical protein E1091_02960 [Micromonospora fluostatini]
MRRCPIAGASPATLQIRAWQSFTGVGAVVREALGEGIAGPPRVGVEVTHHCGLEVSMPKDVPWPHIDQIITEHFGPQTPAPDHDRLVHELQAPLLWAAGNDVDFRQPLGRLAVAERLAVLAARREGDAAAAALSEIRRKLAHLAGINDEVTKALWPDHPTLEVS